MGERKKVPFAHELYSCFSGKPDQASFFNGFTTLWHDKMLDLSIHRMPTDV